MIARPTSNADELRARMRQVRGQLPDDVEGIVAGARQLTDWRYYVRSLPWASLGAAMAVGFLAVPRRLQVVRPDVKTLEELARRQKLVVEPRERVKEKPGMLESALNVAGNMVLRAGLAYAGQKVGAFFGTQAAQPDAPGDRV